MIPYTIMDEHRDAYIHWWRMIDRGFLPRRDNYLLHVDHHDDMLPGGYGRALDHLPENEEEAQDFADECLGISDFIVPAIWQGIFSVCHICKNTEPAEVRSRKLVMERTRSQWLLSMEYMPLFHLARIEKKDPSILLYERKDHCLDDNEDLSGVAGLVLDMDLDYFCWDDSLSSVPEKKMEITKEAYESFVSDRDHPFRILPKRYFFVKEHGGRFYLIYKEPAGQETLPSEEEIVNRMDRFFSWLKTSHAVPAAIDICRSCRSGYLPAERAAFVEREFMNRLHETYREELDLIQ